MKKMPAVVALMAVFSLAICFTVIGSFSLELEKALGSNNEGTDVIGSIIFPLFLTACIVQLFIGPMVDKFGYKPVAIVGFLVISISMFLFAYVKELEQGMAAAALLGIGAMCVNTVGNTLIPVVLFNGKNPARASNFGNAFFGLGMVVTQFLPLLVMKTLGYKYYVGFYTLGIITLVFLFFAVFTSYPKVSIGYRFSMALKLLGKGAVLIAALALLCYISLESSMNTWIRKLMEELFLESGNSNAAYSATLVLTLFGVSMMVGRFVTSTIKNLTSIGDKLISGLSVLSVVTIVLMILAPSPVLAIIAVVLTGLAFAPIFPTIVGVTFAKFEPKLYGSVFGIIFAVGLLGGTFVPKIIGKLSEGSSVQQSLPIAAVMAGIMFIVSLFIGRIGNPERK